MQNMGLRENIEFKMTIHCFQTNGRNLCRNDGTMTCTRLHSRVRKPPFFPCYNTWGNDMYKIKGEIFKGAGGGLLVFYSVSAWQATSVHEIAGATSAGKNTWSRVKKKKSRPHFDLLLTYSNYFLKMPLWEGAQVLKLTHQPKNKQTNKLTNCYESKQQNTMMVAFATCSLTA